MILCKVLHVSTSGYYAWRQRGMSERAKEDRELTRIIVRIHQDSRGTYGSPRIHSELRLAEGIRCGKKRVARLMRQIGISGISRRRKPGITRKDPRRETYPDLVDRQFSAAAPNRLWVADITQHGTGEGWLYLAVILDVYSRRIVGWSMGSRATSALVLDALNMATWSRRPHETTIHHSDHGSQYTSLAFGNRLESAGLLGSMGSVGDVYDNAMMESFMATLETELLDRHSWKTRNELSMEIFDYIEGFYNRRRRHSALGYLSPQEYERRWIQETPEKQAAD